MLIKGIFYTKTVIVIIISFLTIVYMFTSIDKNLIYQTELNSLTLFLNDSNSSSNIVSYFAKLILKFLFQVDLSDTSSFYKNLNPLY